MNKLLNTIIIATLFGALAGAITTKALMGGGSDSSLTKQQQLIKNFYDTETAVLVSPHGLRKAMDKGKDDFILVDLRSPEEYEREHVIGAINIPAYKDPETSAYDDVERIVASFKELGTDKEIIAYCYSIPCMTGRKIGKMLSDHDVFVKELGVGWNEWRHFWTLWNHEHEWDITNVEDYVISGSEPGVPQIRESKNPLSPCEASEEFGC